jgi:hypothetical protein
VRSIDAWGRGGKRASASGKRRRKRMKLKELGYIVRHRCLIVMFYI